MTFNLESLPRWLIKLVQMGLRDKGMYNSVIDGIPGPLTKLAASQFEKEQGGNGNVVTPVTKPLPSGPDSYVGSHFVKASSFADPADIAAFKKCKAKGGTDQECFKVGDNGIGKWGKSTVEGSGPCCALPPEDWNSWAKPYLAKVLVIANGKQVICELRDTMPRKKNIENGAGIDLNPDAVKALGLNPPIMISAEWRWA